LLLNLKPTEADKLAHAPAFALHPAGFIQFQTLPLIRGGVRNPTWNFILNIAVPVVPQCICYTMTPFAGFAFVFETARSGQACACTCICPSSCWFYAVSDATFNKGRG
jgi:hypothetical protein